MVTQVVTLSNRHSFIPQPWKAAKKEVDSCNAELERLKDSNPMLIKSCQQVLRSIMSVRNKKYVFVAFNLFLEATDDANPQSQRQRYVLEYL